MYISARFQEWSLVLSSIEFLVSAHHNELTWSSVKIELHAPSMSSGKGSLFRSPFSLCPRAGNPVCRVGAAVLYLLHGLFRIVQGQLTIY